MFHPPRGSAFRPRRLPTALFLGLMVLALINMAPAWAAGPAFSLQQGDRICFVGNTLAERFHLDGWLETELQTRHPASKITVRNLGYSGDELTLRLRSANFGTPDEWLDRCDATVVFAFFGYGESFAGEAGLPKFKEELKTYVEHLQNIKFVEGKPCRVVLFTPIAHENLESPHLPDGSANNARLRLYANAMIATGAELGVPVVDLFTISQRLYAANQSPLTINGIHLTAEGDRLLAAEIGQSLFGAGRPTAQPPYKLEDLRAAIHDKDFHWFERYRTTDGFSVYGGRADLKFVNGQTNREVAQREMEVLDVMTANRDAHIHSILAGKPQPIDDSNTPPFIPVITNKPGKGPNGTHLFLSGEEAIKLMKVGKGMEVSLFADETMFPELIKPVQMAFDTKGRLWVATWPSYPHWKPKAVMDDRLLILEDTNGDGKADVCKTFAGGLHNPTGFEFWGGGVIVARGPDILFLKDIDGDDKADIRESILHGLDTADTHHTSNSFTLDPGGALYFQEGTFHHTQVESPWGPTRRVANAAVFRYEPRAQKFDIYVSFGFANPHGHAFDAWGLDIITDGTGSQPYHGALFSGHVEFPNKHNRPPQVYQQWTRPCPGIEMMTGSHFPPEMDGNLLVGNVITFQGILNYKITPSGGSVVGEQAEPIISSSDPNFRPSDLEVGPDGALWFLDWQNPIIGHMQHNLRDPSRDHTHGRVYRVTYPSRPLSKSPAIAGAPIPALLENLKHPDNRVRYRTRIELSNRPGTEVVPAVLAWAGTIQPTDEATTHQLLEALWICQHHDSVNVPLLERVLSTKDFRARAAATRVLCYWRDRVPHTLDMLRALAADEHPRVRMEAVRAASFLTEPAAMEIPVIAGQQPQDQYVDFVRGETERTLMPFFREALAKNVPIPFKTPAGARYYLKNLSTEELLKQPSSAAVAMEMLYRPGLQDAKRAEAVKTLAMLTAKPELTVIFDALRYADEQAGTVDTSVIFDLVRQLNGRSSTELTTVRAELERLATTAKQPILRQVGFISLMTVDQSSDKAWTLAGRSVQGLVDFANAVPLIADTSLRASLYDRLLPLLQGPPATLSKEAVSTGPLVRYVRVSLPRKGTLTIAEVEVMSQGVNVARKGRATQKNTAYGGNASRGIDGNTSPDYGDGGETHTEENTDNPWWELDLGEDVPVEAVTIYNRSEPFVDRLKGFTLSLRDSSGGFTYEAKNNPAPNLKSTFPLEGMSGGSLLRRAVMNALVSVRGREAETFTLLAGYIERHDDTLAAVRALQRVPQNAWPANLAGPLVTILAADLAKLPPAERTTAAASDYLQFADQLTSLMPADAARAARAELRKIGVRVIRVSTLPERMSYDKDVIAVQAGTPVEFDFVNPDLMPHNFVLLAPGSLEEIGMYSETNSQSPDFAKRQFVPASRNVLLASGLLQPRDSQKLSFTAPKKPGVYPYVCTYPGHWRRMYGALYVVEQIDDYLEAPEAYLAKHPLTVADALLKDRRPRTEWTFNDLEASVGEGLQGGRSFANGRQMFQVASCIACHKLEGKGNEFGPDLAKLDAKMSGTELLKHILEPSAKIDEKYRSWSITMEDGRVYSGMILSESPTEVKIIENPLAKAEATTILKRDIDERAASKTSLMPKGLLDKLSRDEVLDLLAYVFAKGDPSAPVFQNASSGHNHAGGQAH